MSLGCTFPEALNKAVQSLEIGVDALDGSGRAQPVRRTQPAASLAVPVADRLFKVYRAIQQGIPLESIARETGYDPWFLGEMQVIASLEKRSESGKQRTWRVSSPILSSLLSALCQKIGFADAHIARL